MTAREIISKQFIPVLAGEDSNTALRLMNEQWVKHLPVVEDGKLIGLLRREDLIILDPKENIDQHVIMDPGSYINEDDHLLRVIKHMVELKLTPIPVV